MVTPRGRHVAPRGRRIALPAFVMVGATVLALFLAEGIVRLLRVQGDASYQADRRFGWSHIPGKRGLYVSPKARSRFTINRNGLMGPERPYEKPDDARRILLLGDSFTESMQVPYAATWGAILEDLLPGRWESLNGGVAGYGTDNALLFLREEGLRYAPDFVFLLFFTGNDVSDNDHALSRRIGQGLPKPYFTLAPDGGDHGDELVLHQFPLPEGPTGPLTAAKDFLRERSRLYLLAREQIHRLRALRRGGGQSEPTVKEENDAAIPLTWHVYLREPGPEWERAWRMTGALLREMSEICATRGIPLAVGVLPTGWRIEKDERSELLERYPGMADTLRWDFRGPDLRVLQLCQEAGIPHLDLTPPLRAARDRDGDPLYGDHLTAAGHQVVARAVAEFIWRGLNPEDPDPPRAGASPTPR